MLRFFVADERRDDELLGKRGQVRDNGAIWTFGRRRLELPEDPGNVGYALALQSGHGDDLLDDLLSERGQDRDNGSIWTFGRRRRVCKDKAGDVGFAQALQSSHGQVRRGRAVARAALPDMEIALDFGLFEGDPALALHARQVDIASGNRFGCDGLAHIGIAD